jgi:MFS family permease
MQALTVSALLLELQRAILTPVLGEYLVEIFGSASYAGLIEGVSNIIMIAVNIFGVHLILKIGKVKLFMILMLVLAVLNLLLALFHIPLLFIVNYSLFLAAYGLAWFCLNLIVKRYTPEAILHSTESKVYVSSNIAWLSAPIIGGAIATNLSIRTIFLVASLSALCMVVSFYRQRKHFPPSHPSKIKPSIHLRIDLREFIDNQRFKSHFVISAILRL